MTLREVKTGETVKVKKLNGEGPVKSPARCKKAAGRFCITLAYSIVGADDSVGPKMSRIRRKVL